VWLATHAVSLKKEKGFFFEKKNQKTFISVAAWVGGGFVRARFAPRCVIGSAGAVPRSGVHNWIAWPIYNQSLHCMPHPQLTEA
jgi:hypothetical protein